MAEPFLTVEVYSHRHGWIGGALWVVGRPSDTKYLRLAGIRTPEQQEDALIGALNCSPLPYYPSPHTRVSVT